MEIIDCSYSIDSTDYGGVVTDILTGALFEDKNFGNQKDLYGIR